MNYFRAIDRSKVLFDFLVHRKQKGAYEDEIEQLGGRIFRIPALNVLKIASYNQAVSHFFDAHPEYRMVHGHCSELGYFIYRQAHKRGFEFIAAHAHSSPKEFDLKMPFRNLLKHLMRPHLTHYFSCGLASAQWLFGCKLAKKTMFLPNAINARSFSYNSKKREKVRFQHGWEKRFVVGNISRFSYPKNHLFLVDVFAEILHKDSSALLVLVGSGGNMERQVRNKIDRLGIGSNVCFMGSRSDIADLLQGMDVFLFPSLFEGFSVSMLEAQASGIKIINSTNIPKEGTIIPEIVDSLSLKLPVGQWAEKVLQAAKNHPRKDRYEEVAQLGFDIKKNAEWLQNLYMEISPR